MNNLLDGPAVGLTTGSEYERSMGAAIAGTSPNEAEIDPEKVVICHCTDCRTLSGFAFRTVALTRESACVSLLWSLFGSTAHSYCVPTPGSQADFKPANFAE